VVIELETEKMIAKVEDGIGWMTFNNPDRRNAVSLEMWAAIPTILDAFDADDRVRVIVMKGAGDRAFVAGADISEFDKRRSSAAESDKYGDVAQGAHRALKALQKPMLAMVQGYCIGGGLAIALYADMRIVTEDSRFAIPAARLGLGYAFDGLGMLVDLVGPSYAREIMFTARQFSAEEALRIGLANRVVPRAALEATVRDYATTIAGNAPLTIRAAKAAIAEVLKDPEVRDLKALEAITRACFDSADYAEGRLAFREKRSPNFTGK
jgi:enoyl-CoA hydratase/carnithine racemase